MMSRIILKKGREDSVRRFHPWIFSGAVASVEGEPSEGDVVAVYSSNGEILGCGHWQIGSISVRLLSFGTETLPDNFWEEKLGACLRMRKALGLASNNGRTNCYRLVHGEGDGLPGLIVDYYAGTCVLQAHSVGMFISRSRITEALKTIYGEGLSAVYDKSSGTAPFKAGLDLCDGYLFRSVKAADTDSGYVLENGHRFIVDWENGQKTGFFLDQRENRALVERYASGRNVLNLFCYTGGFSVYALAAGALSVDSVDSSSKAIELVDRNIELNGFSHRHHSFCEDAIDFVKNSQEGRYDLIIVDPPAFAKHRGALHNALRAYQRLNAAAIEKVAKGGLVFTFSCSQVVDKQAFALAVFSAAAQVGRHVRILDRLCQPADHSVNIFHPEGEYLKGLMLYVE
ncbi:MAG: class I SAM-dependent rRNA methyltransferase [Bacteroidales bacterium]|nr:class I SAM-dependent rRNA methyltransferase [Candidatus Cacconaster merdequi]